MIWIYLFAACLTFLFSLPMLPAAIEWRRKRDAAPLQVVREHDGKITHFASEFWHFLHVNLPARPKGDVADAVLANGDPCQFVGGAGVPKFTPEEVAAKSTTRLFIGVVPLKLPAGCFFETEIYAMQGIASGSRTVIRALLSEGDVLLGESCDIIRWAHAGGSLECGSGSRLYGRVSSGTAITVHRKTLLGRMHAPVIRFGQASAPVAPADVDLLAPWPRPPHILNEAAGRWLIGGDVVLPAGVRHEGDLVVRGRLEIGSRSRVDGSIKSTRRLLLEPEATVSGAAICAQNMLIKRGCRVAGPIVVEGTLVIESGCVIGEPGKPTTITADEIRVAEGSVVHGTIWPRKEGWVVDKTAGGQA